LPKLIGAKKLRGFFEAQVAVGHRVDVADVGGHHHVGRHGLFQLAQHLARVQVVTAVEGLLLLVLVDHVEAEGVALVGPLVEFLFPGGLFAGDGLSALGLGGVAGQGAAGQALRQRQRGGLGVAADADGDLLHQAQHLVVGVDLDDLGLLGQ
jgi:hypothetical protein